jgi:hypothetical protein
MPHSETPTKPSISETMAPFQIASSSPTVTSQRSPMAPIHLYKTHPHKNHVHTTIPFNFQTRKMDASNSSYSPSSYNLAYLLLIFHPHILLYSHISLTTINISRPCGLVVPPGVWETSRVLSPQVGFACYCQKKKKKKKNYN